MSLASRDDARCALAELFLDRDLADSIDGIASRLATLPLSVPELESVLIDEVHPVCRANLASPAGVWSGFEPASLLAAIERRIARRSQWGRYFDRLRARRFVRASRDWSAVKDGIRRLRGERR